MDKLLEQENIIGRLTQDVDNETGSPDSIADPTDQTIIFVTGANLSKCFHFECARNLGLKVVVIDSPESDGATLQKNGCIDIFIAMELSTVMETALDQCLAVINGLDETFAVVGVVTFMDMAVLLTSLIAESLKLPGLPTRGVSIARDKRLTRKVTEAAGISSILHYPIESLKDLEDAASHVGFPAVLKPIIGADSLGVRRVDSIDELHAAFNESLSIVSQLTLTSGMLCKATCPIPGDKTSTIVLPPEFILEEYIDGTEVDVDIVIDRNGEVVYAAVSDNGKTCEPYFTETFGILPSRLVREDQEALIELGVASLSALGFAAGVYHIEAKLSPTKGAKLIEINPRLGGGPIREMHLQVAGIDLASEKIRLAFGNCVSGCVIPSKSREFAYMTTNAISSGIIGDDLSFLDVYRAYEGVINISCRVRGGDFVVGPSDGQPSWLVEIWMATRDSNAVPVSGEDNAAPVTRGDILERLCVISDMIGCDFEKNYYH